MHNTRNELGGKKDQDRDRKEQELEWHIADGSERRNTARLKWNREKSWIKRTEQEKINQEQK